ncbi:hypothetical protein BC628DRAFT_509519 [Trametes gibbosa]|nr:hypothetical protein BC628DRAFT_509519 [Trametes gibbosa]
MFPRLCSASALKRLIAPSRFSAVWMPGAPQEHPEHCASLLATIPRGPAEPCSRTDADILLRLLPVCSLIYLRHPSQGDTAVIFPAPIYHARPSRATLRQFRHPCQNTDRPLLAPTPRPPPTARARLIDFELAHGLSRAPPLDIAGMPVRPSYRLHDPHDTVPQRQATAR